MSWVLVIYIYAGMLANGDSVTITHISGFRTEEACKAAGKSTEPLVQSSAKELRFVCVKQDKAV